MLYVYLFVSMLHYFPAEVPLGSLARFKPYHLDHSCFIVIGTWNLKGGVFGVFFIDHFHCEECQLMAFVF